MQQARLPTISHEDYLQGEFEGDVRHEYVDGHAYAMAGAGENHNIIALNLAAELRRAARGTDCRAFISDMKLRIAELNRFYYPDVLLACDPEDNDAYFKDRPCLIVEVLSPSTEATDRREKLHAYQQIPSLKEYVLVSQDAPKIEPYRRSEDHWQYFLLDDSADILQLECLDLELNMAAVFEDVFDIKP